MSSEHREGYVPRLSIDLTQKQFDKLKELVPYGMKNRIFSAIVDDLIEALEQGGTGAIAALITKSLTLNSTDKSKSAL